VSERGEGLNEKLISSINWSSKAKESEIMRIYEGDHAYEVERILDPTTQLYTGWRYKVYRIRPNHELLRSGEAPTQRDAEKAGRRVLGSVIKSETRAKDAERKRAA
jgi:hypothetical protein